MATWNNMSLQDSTSPLMEQLNFFHDHTMSIIMLITMMVTYKMVQMMCNKKSFRYMLSEHFIETIWTTIPAVMLMFIALPSLHLLYLIDDSLETSITIKTIGRQWYWSYEYSYPKSNNMSCQFLLMYYNFLLLYYMFMTNMAGY